MGKKTNGKPINLLMVEDASCVVLSKVWDVLSLFILYKLATWKTFLKRKLDIFVELVRGWSLKVMMRV